MDFIRDLQLLETQATAAKEIIHCTDVVNKIYGEWKKIKRRTNAVDLITTSANKLATLNPESVRRVHDATRLKLVIVLMRCMDLPPWKSVSAKEKVYKKLYPLLKAMENIDPNTGTNGKLKEVVMTRLSAAISTQDPEKARVFVGYEPVIPSQYLRYLFGSDLPLVTYRMMSLSLPEDFEELVELLTINHEKAKLKFKNEGGVKNKP